VRTFPLAKDESYTPNVRAFLSCVSTFRSYFDVDGGSNYGV
jgi:hypothetical protein